MSETDTEKFKNPPPNTLVEAMRECAQVDIKSLLEVTEPTSNIDDVINVIAVKAIPGDDYDIEARENAHQALGGLLLQTLEISGVEFETLYAGFIRGYELEEFDKTYAYYIFEVQDFAEVANAFLTLIEGLNAQGCVCISHQIWYENEQHDYERGATIPVSPWNELFDSTKAFYS